MQNAIWKVTALAGLVGIGFLVVLQAQRGLPLPAGPAAGTQPAATGGDGSGRADSTSAADVTAGGDDAPLFDQSEPEPASETRDLTGGDEQPSEDNPFFAANSAASSRAEALSDDSDGMTVIRSVRNSTSGGIDFRQPPPQDEPQFEPQDEPARLDVSEARPVPVPQRDADTESFAADATAVEPIPTEAERGEVRLTRNEAPPFGSTEADPMGEPGFGTEPAFGNESPARDEPTFGSDPEIVPVPAGVHEDEPPSFDPATDEPDAGSDPGPRLLLIGPQDAADRSNAGAGEPSAEADGERAFEPEAMPADADEEQSEDPRTVPFSSSAEETTPGDAEATPGGSRPEPIPDPFGAGGGTVPRTQPNDENRMASPPTVGDDPFGSSPSAFEETAEPKTSPSPQPVEIDAPSIHGRADERHPAAQPTGPADSADDAAHDAGSPSEVPGELPTAGRVVPLESDELRGDGTVEPYAPSGPQRPQLTIDKQAPSVAVLGKPLVYYILVRNLGSSAARQVTVEDRIPLGTQLTGTIPRAELREKTVVWKLGTLEPGAEQKIAVRIVPTNEGQIGSVATVNFVAEVSSRTTITAPKLSLEMSGPEQVKLGRPVRFHFKLSNAGSGTASNVYLRSLIPRELRHPAGNDLEYKVGDLPAGQSREIDLTLTAVDEGSAEHKAIITADGGFSIEHSAEVEVLGSQLRLSRTGPKRRYVGRDAVFTNTVANDSTQPIAGVSVVETLPDGMEFVEASDGGTFDARSRTVTWRIDRLEPQSGRELQVTLLAKAAGTMPCDVRATEAGGDTARLTAETQVEGFTALGVRVPENPQPVAVGETLTLRIVAGNKGTEPASHVKVSVEVPPELELVSARGPSRETREGRRVSFAAVEELGGGADEEYQLVLKAVSAGKGDARVQIEVEADELARPLQREEAVYILAE